MWLNGFVDSYGVWLLAKKVTHLESSRAKFFYITDYLTSTDRGLSLHTFLVLLRKQDSMVHDNFAEAAHPGYLSFDLLLKIRLLHSIDLVFYATPIERLMDDFPEPTAVQATSVFRSNPQERGSASVPLSTSSSKALVAQDAPSVVALSTSGSGPSLPQSNLFNPDRLAWMKSHGCHTCMQFCPRCWDSGGFDLKLNFYPANECKDRRTAQDAAAAAKKSKVR